MTGKERIQRILKHQPVDRIGLYEHFWNDTYKAWEQAGHLKNGESYEDHFGFDVQEFWAFNLVADDLACKVSNSALAQILESAQQDGNEIMVFVGNRGCVQIFTGVVEKVVPMKGWLNIFNPTFTLHLLEESIAETWVTRKPASDGYVTSLELFAHDGTQIAQLYGQRTEGEQEQAQWRKQIASLIPEGVTA